MKNPGARDPAIWNEAGERVENHLRAYRITDPAWRSQLREEIIDRAGARQEREPGRAGAELAAEETEHYLREWIDRLFGPTDETPLRRFARGRAAIYLVQSDAGVEKFLGGQELPPKDLEDVRSFYLEAGPDLEFGSMVPRPIDLGPVSSAADETWRTFAKWPALRGLAIGMLSVTLMGTAFFLVHF